MAAMTRNTVLLLVLVTTAVLLCSVVPAAAASRRVLVGQQPQAATDSVKGLGGGVTGVGAGGAGDTSLMEMQPTLLKTRVGFMP
jgi:hypothetical protein